MELEDHIHITVACVKILDNKFARITGIEHTRSIIIHNGDLIKWKGMFIRMNKRRLSSNIGNPTTKSELNQ